MKRFLKVIMYNDVTGCVIFIPSKVEYRKKEGKKFYQRS